jgi:hypothetical protein
MGYYILKLMDISFQEINNVFLKKTKDNPILTKKNELLCLQKRS